MLILRNVFNTSNMYIKFNNFMRSKTEIYKLLCFSHIFTKSYKVIYFFNRIWYYNKDEQCFTKPVIQFYCAQYILTRTNMYV